LIIRHPGGVGIGRRIPALVQLPDLMPTILDFLDVPVPEFVQARSLRPLIASETDSVHDHVFSGRFPRTVHLADTEAFPGGAMAYDGRVGPDDVSEAVTVTNEDWSLICSPRGRPSELYDLKRDPGQTNNVIRDHLDIAVRMRDAWLAFMKKHGASPDHLELWGQPAEEMIEPHGRPPDRLMPGDLLYVHQDPGGKAIAFCSRKDAASVLDCDPEGLSLEQKHFAAIRQADPQSLIYMDQQYYWAQDLG
jgi:arylsulfatase A-like enzyme